MNASDAPPDAPLPGLRHAVAQRMAAERDGASFPAAELAAIDTAVRRRTERSPSTSLSGRLRVLEAAADIDVDPPVASDQRGGRGVKVAVAKLTSWYVGHLAAQVRELATATARATRGVAARLDELEHRIEELERDGDDPVRHDAGERP